MHLLRWRDGLRTKATEAAVLFPQQQRHERMTDPPPWQFERWCYVAFGVLIVIMFLLRYFNPRPW